MGNKAFPSGFVENTSPTGSDFTLVGNKKATLINLVAAVLGANNAVGMPQALADIISSGKVFALQQISTNGVQIAESTTLVEILAIDLYVVTSAQTAPSWRLIFGAYGLHLVPSDYGGAGVVTINGVADIVTFAEAGVYLLVGDGANAWTLTPATDYSAIDGAIAAVQDAADAAQTRADDAYDLAQDAYNGLSSKLDNAGHTATSVLVTDGSGNVVDSTPSTTDRLFTYISGVIAWTQLTIGMIADRLITWAKLPAVAAHSLVARSANSSGDAGDLTIGTDEGVWNVAGVLTSQKAKTANIDDAAITLAKIASSDAYLDVTGATQTADGSYALYGVSYAAALCTITFATTNWPIGATRVFEKMNTSSFAIVFAPPSGGTINGAAPDATMTAPGSGNVSATTRGNLFWVVTRTGANAFQVRGGQVQASQTNDSIIGGTGQANRFITTGSGSAGTPAFRLSDADSGLYWDATKGIVASVDSVDRMSLRADGINEFIRSGSSVRILRVTNGSGSACIGVCSGSPEGVVSDSPGALALDVTNGKLYVKRTGSGNTGWVLHERCESGTYTPIGTTVTNLDSVTPQLCTYVRVGDVVTVFGAVTIDPTASGTVACGISLPVASNFAAASDLSGTAIAGQFYIGVAIADATNDRAEITLSNTLTTSYAFRFSFSYRVL